MADFTLADASRVAHEGGYANHSADAGGETWAGIAIASHPQWAGWPIVHAALAKLGLTPADTLGTAAAKYSTWKRVDAQLAGDATLRKMVAVFYREEYWKPLDLEDEPDQALATMAYDKAVNFGVEPAKAMLAEARKSA